MSKKTCEEERDEFLELPQEERDELIERLISKRDQDILGLWLKKHSGGYLSKKLELSESAIGTISYKAIRRVLAEHNKGKLRKGMNDPVSNLVLARGTIIALEHNNVRTIGELQQAFFHMEGMPFMGSVRRREITGRLKEFDLLPVVPTADIQPELLAFPPIKERKEFEQLAYIRHLLGKATNELHRMEKLIHERNQEREHPVPEDSEPSERPAD